MVSQVVGTVIGANASRKAASIQDKAAQRAADQIDSQYAQNRQDTMPWLTQGTNALNQLSDYLGTSGNTEATGYGSLIKPFTQQDFVEDPGYQFSLAEGQKALERSSAARGGLLSGSALKAAQTYGQGMAAQQYNDVYNRYTNNQNNIYNKLAGVAGTGQTAANTLGTQGLSAANAAGDLRTSGAAARAAGVVGSANAWTSGLNSWGNPATYIKYLNPTGGA